MTPDFGLHYSCQSVDGEWNALYSELLSQIQEAESLGYSSISVAEHHFLSDGWVPSPLVFLGGVAAVTDSVDLVSNVVVLPLHHPVAVAERATVLDLISGGRLKLGVAIGWRDEEFEGYGRDKTERVARVVDGVKFIRKLTAERNVSYEGKAYTFEDIDLTPRPVQQPIPIWYGGQSEYAVKRAAHIADAWSVSPIETRDELATKDKLYRDELQAAGRSTDSVRTPLRREAYIAEDDETAWAEVGESLLYEYEDVYGDYDDIGHSFDSETPGQDAIEALRAHAEDRFIVGSPETAIEELERYRETLDVDEFILRMHFPGLDPKKAATSMRLLANKVMPHFDSDQN